MRVVCSYYHNNRHLGLVLSRLEESNDIVVVPIYGAVIRMRNDVRCIGEHVEILVYGRGEKYPILLTNSSEFSGCSATPIEYETSARESIYMQALRLCIQKNLTSSNPFVMECALNGCTVVATAKNTGTISYAMRTPAGELLTESESIPQQIYTQCQSIRGFKYSIVTDTCEKEISVKKGQVEIFREIAHYINKVLVFSKVDRFGSVIEYCISSTGCCEVITLKSGSTKIVKIPFTKVKIDPACSLAAIDCTLDVLLRSNSLSSALRGVDVCAQN